MNVSSKDTTPHGVTAPTVAEQYVHWTERSWKGGEDRQTDRQRYSLNQDKEMDGTGSSSTKSSTRCRPQQHHTQQGSLSISQTLE